MLQSTGLTGLIKVNAEDFNKISFSSFKTTILVLASQNT